MSCTVQSSLKAFHLKIENGPRYPANASTGDSRTHLRSFRSPTFPVFETAQSLVVLFLSSANITSPM